MDKNTIVGFVLIAAILIGFQLYMSPSEEEIAAQQQYNDSVATAQNLAKEQQLLIDQAYADSVGQVEKAYADSIRLADQAKLDSLNAINPALADSLLAAREAEKAARMQAAKATKNAQFGRFSMSGGSTPQYYTIENDEFIATVSSTGGKIVALELKNFKTYDSAALFLWKEEHAKFGFEFAEGGNKYNTSDLYFATDGGNIKVTGEEEKSLVMRLYEDDSRNNYVEYTYTIKGNSPHLSFDFAINGLPDLVPASNPQLALNWEIRGLKKEKSLSAERRYSTVMYRYFDEKRDYIWEGRDDEAEMEQKTRWIDFKQNFFSAFLVNETGFSDNGSKVWTTTFQESDEYLLGYGADMRIDVQDRSRPAAHLEFLFIENSLEKLGSYERDYEEVVDLGWAIFGWVNRFLVIPIFNLLQSTGMAYGIIILLLTIFIKIILFPLMYRNYKSSAKMRVLRPEINAINEKFPDKADAMKRQQGTMELYRKTGVNPFSGCVPMLIQMPILYAMFRFFPAAIELRGESFLWADDLSGYDSIIDLGFEIPFYGDHVSLFTLMMAASTLIYTRMNSANMSMPSQPGMPNMKVMMYIFPFMMIFFFNSFSSALSYYYFLSNVISITQIWAVKRFMIDEDKIREKIDENKKKPKKKSRFQERLEEVQRQRATANKK